MLIPAEFQPQPALEPYIKCHWTLSSSTDSSEPESNSGQAKQFLPDGGLKICFNLASPVQFDLLDGNVMWATNGSVCGALTSNYWLHLDESIHSIGVQFHPGGAYPFIPFPVDTLTDTICDLDRVWGNAGRELTSAMHRPELTTHQRIELVEAFLIERLARFEGRDAEFESAAQIIVGQEGKVSLDRLSEKVGLSLRQLERKFHQKSGMAPKRLCRILRFRHLFEHITAHPTDRWVDTALTCGYFDQAHLIHDFKQFTGMSPAVFIKEIVNQDRFITWGYDLEALASFGLKVSEQHDRVGI